MVGNVLCPKGNSILETSGLITTCESSRKISTSWHKTGPHVLPLLGRGGHHSDPARAWPQRDQRHQARSRGCCYRSQKQHLLFRISTCPSLIQGQLDASTDLERQSLQPLHLFSSENQELGAANQGEERYSQVPSCQNPCSSASYKQYCACLWIEGENEIKSFK